MPSGAQGTLHTRVHTPHTHTPHPGLFLKMTPVFALRTGCWRPPALPTRTAWSGPASGPATSDHHQETWLSCWSPALCPPPPPGVQVHAGGAAPPGPPRSAPRREVRGLQAVPAFVSLCAPTPRKEVTDWPPVCAPSPALGTARGQGSAGTAAARGSDYKGSEVDSWGTVALWPRGPHGTSLVRSREAQLPAGAHCPGNGLFTANPAGQPRGTGLETKGCGSPGAPRGARPQPTTGHLPGQVHRGDGPPA